MGSNGLVSILMLVGLFAIMYFLMIRPQKKREKQTNAMRAGIQVGDEIITIGGICAKVVKTKSESLIIQVGSDRVKMEVMRWSVSKVVKESSKHNDILIDDDDEEEVTKAVGKGKPRRMKKAAVVEEEPAVEEASEEVVETAEEAKEEE